MPVCSSDCPFKNDPTGQCKAFVSYVEPIDRLVILYAITQQSVNDPNAAAFFSAITLSCGCQCDGKPASKTSVMPIAGAPGTCKAVANTSPSFGCDFMGKFWCEAEDTTRWTLTGASGACVEVPSTVRRPISTYEPTVAFAVRPEP